MSAPEPHAPMWTTIQALQPVKAAALPRLLHSAGCTAPGAVPSLSGLAWIRLDLEALDRCLCGVHLAAWPLVPPRAVRSRQLAFVAGRLCAEAALQQLGAPHTVGVARGDVGQPLWPGGWTGAISHTGRSALAVAGCRQGDCDLGVDVEPLIDPRTQPAVLQQCVHDSERAWLQAAASFGLALTVLFSAKEAYYKAVYRRVRRFIDFKEVAVSAWSPQRGTFQIGPAPGAAGTIQLPTAPGWFVEQGGEVTTAVAPGYGALTLPTERLWRVIQP